MAINLPIVTQFSDKGIKSAKAAFANFKTDVGNATGAMGKFKAGSNAALNAVKANAGNFAMAAGAALVGFAAKSVGAFQDLAISSGKFADATGLSVEEASRFIEVGGDIGIEAGTIEASIGKMNKVLGATPKVFQELGVEIAKTGTGATDVNQTFLNVIDRLNAIKDPAQRAAAASQLLGKGWQSMAELIALGSDELSKSLSQVSDAKVIDEGEVKKARDFRAAMDNLNDKVEDLSLTLGEELVPSLIAAADGIIMVADALTFEVDGVSSASGGLSNLSKLWDKVTGSTEAAEVALSTYGRRQTDARSDMTRLNEAIEEQEDGVAKLTTEWQTLLGTLDTREAFDNLEESFGAVFDAGIKAFGGGAEEIRKFNAEQKNAIDQIADLATALDLTFGEQNRLKIFVDSGDLRAAGDYLKTLATGFGVDLGFGIGLAGARANGGPVSGGSSYLVGERGPEIFTPSGSGMISANGAGGTTNVTVNVQGADPNAVVSALQRYVRLSGPVPITTRSM
jgi:hypothetical protein